MYIQSQEQKEKKQFTKYTGIGMFEVSLNKVERELLTYEKVKNKIDNTEVTTNNLQIEIPFTFTEPVSGVKINKSIYIINKPSEEGFLDEKIGIRQKRFINEVGRTFDTISEDDLKEGSTHKANPHKWFSALYAKANKDDKEMSFVKKINYFEALQGEHRLYNLLRCVTSIDDYDPKSNIVLDRKKLFNKDFSEIQQCLNVKNKEGKPFLVKCLVFINDKGYMEIFSPIFNNWIFPGNELFKLEKIDKPKFDNQKFINQVMDTQYGCLNKLFKGLAWVSENEKEKKVSNPETEFQDSGNTSTTGDNPPQKLSTNDLPF